MYCSPTQFNNSIPGPDILNSKVVPMHAMEEYLEVEV